MSIPPLVLDPVPSLPGLNPKASPLEYFKLAAAEYLSKTLEIPLDFAYSALESGKTGKGAVGDLAVALPKFRLKSDPKANVAKVLDNFVPNMYLASVQAIGFHLAFHLNTATYIRLVLETINYCTYLSPPPPATDLNFGALSLEPPAALASHLFKTGGFGTNTSGEGKKIIVEFSSPNIAKPFHAGHLRSTIIGAFLANLYSANGWSVMKMNYLGDWGKQFGILAVGFQTYGSEAQLEQDAITHLYDVYVKINQDADPSDPAKKVEHDRIHDEARAFFVGMENGDVKSLALWKKFRDLSIVKYQETYARLNIHFDLYSGESQVSKESQEKALEQLSAKGIVQESDNALIVDLEKYKLGKTVIRKKDGTYVYITRDIAGAAERWEQYKFDKMIYVVANQQDLHLAQFFKVLDLMEYSWQPRLQHVNFGMVQGMSTRRGTAVFLEEILNESKDVMHTQMKSNEVKYNSIDDPEETADKLGITAVKIQDMAAKRGNNYKFEWGRMTSFEGDTGPYLQYAHVRLSSVERKAAPEIILPPASERASKIDTSLLCDSRPARDIVHLLATYPSVVEAAMINHEPSTIVTFCFRLCHSISSAWETVIVKNQKDPNVSLARLYLFVCAKDVLADAMKLLTLEPLTKM